MKSAVAAFIAAALCSGWCVQPVDADPLMSADCVNCASTPTAQIMWTGTTTDVGWPYVAPASFMLAEIDTNFAGDLGSERTITAEIFSGIPSQPGATLLSSVSFFSSLAHGRLGGAAFPVPVPLVQGQQYFIGFLNVGGLGLNVDADNDFRGSLSDPDDSTDTCDGQIPPDPSCDPDGAALRLLGSPALGGLHIDTDGSGSFQNIDTDLAPVALDAPILNLLAPAVAATPTPGSCVGDCNGDGMVTVAELITMVNITLGSRPVGDCIAGDRNGDGQIAISEIIAAVNSALNSCNPPATPTPGTPAPTATPTPIGTMPPPPGAALSETGAVAVVTNALIVTADVIGAISNGVQFGSAAAPALAGSGGGAAGMCPLGGTATRTGSFPFVNIQLTGCKAATSDGSVTFDGSVSVQLTSFTVNITMTFADSGGTQTAQATAMLNGSVSPSLGGSCFVTAATLTVNSGSLSTMTASGAGASITFQNTTLAVDHITFNPSCVPQTYNVALNGAAALLGNGGQTVNVSFTNLTADVDSSTPTTTVVLAGQMASPCFGGSAALTTTSPLSVPGGEVCPVAGMIAVKGNAMVDVTFMAGGAVGLDLDGNGTIDDSAPNCLDPRLLMCAA